MKSSLYILIFIFFAIPNSWSVSNFENKDLTGSTISQTVSASAKGINLQWSPNTEPDINDYIIYMSLNGLDSFTTQSIVSHPTATQQSGQLVKNNDYYWTLTARDISGNESGPAEIIKVKINNSSPKFSSSVLYR